MCVLVTVSGRLAIPMKELALTILLTLFATPAWATTYYLAPASAGGNDSNNGLSASTPWLTPNHPVNCGDVILAAAVTGYSAASFGPRTWGPVTCPNGAGVAWLKCASFDACKISSSTAAAMVLDASYWGVQGWEVLTTGTGSGNLCYLIYPRTPTTTIHHIIFANDIANGCSASGIGTGNDGTGVDYLAVIGNIVYNSSSGTASCDSGIGVYEPVQTDNLPGTHIYVAGNFSWKNVDGNGCYGGTPSDGEGIIFDTFKEFSYSSRSRCD